MVTPGPVPPLKEEAVRNRSMGSKVEEMGFGGVPGRLQSKIRRVDSRPGRQKVMNRSRARSPPRLAFNLIPFHR